MSARLPQTRTGFTLIEVLVALAVIAVGAAAVLTALNTAAGATARVSERMLAEFVAVNRITETRLLRAERLQPGESSGETELGGRRWFWQETVSKAPLPGVLRIDVRVRARDEQEWILERSGAVGAALAPAGSGPDPRDAPLSAPPTS
jgi:general secretion pathway protein I